MSDLINGDAPQPCPMNDQAVAWALHALEPDEELAMRTHLPGCRSCRDVVQETELVMGELAASVELVDPPARLRDSILAAAAETPQMRPETPLAKPWPGPRSPDSGSIPRRAESDGAGNDGRLAARERPRPRRWLQPNGRRSLVTAAVAVVAVICVGGLALYTAQVQQQLNAQIAQSQSLADIVTQMDQPGTAHATLSTGAGEAVAAVLVIASERTVVAAGLPPNDRNDTIYVVWGLGTDNPRPLGAFDIAAPGSSVHSVGSAADGKAFSSYAISLESGRDMPATPTTVVASGAVRR
jgi:Anti-sigma-K factor rskA